MSHVIAPKCNVENRFDDRQKRKFTNQWTYLHVQRKKWFVRK